MMKKIIYLKLLCFLFSFLFIDFAYAGFSEVETLSFSLMVEESTEEGGINENDIKLICPDRVKAGEEFELAASVGIEREQDLIYSWDLDGDEIRDFSNFIGSQIKYRHNKPGDLIAYLEVTDWLNNKHQKQCSIDVGNPSLNGKVKIIELLANPTGNDSAKMPQGEWVKIKNEGEYFIDLAGWVLYDSDNTHELFLTVENSETTGQDNKTLLIEPQGELIIYRNGDNDFSLNNEGDKIRLCTGPIEMLGEIIDEVEYGSLQEGETWKSERSVQSYLVPFRNIIPNVFASQNDCLETDFSDAPFSQNNWLPDENRKLVFKVKNSCDLSQELYLNTEEIQGSDKDKLLNKKYWEVTINTNLMDNIGYEKTLPLEESVAQKIDLGIIEPEEEKQFRYVLKFSKEAENGEQEKAIDLILSLVSSANANSNINSPENNNLNQTGTTTELKTVNLYENIFASGGANNLISANSNVNDNNESNDINLNKSDNNKNKAKNSKKSKSDEEKEKNHENNNVLNPSISLPGNNDNDSIGKNNENLNTPKMIASQKSVKSPLAFWHKLGGIIFSKLFLFLWIIIWGALLTFYFIKRAGKRV